MRAILIDDEPLALDFLERQINGIARITVIEKFVRFEIQEHIGLLNQIDIVFLDIEMPEISGLEMAEKILEINANLIIVFVTAYNDYAVQAFELNALDYILKPVRVDRLQKTVERIETKIKQLNVNNELVSSTQSLRINVCRELSFQIGDKIETIQWRTAKAKELYLYLLHHQEKTIRKAELIELLWPEFEQTKAYPYLYTTIYHIRKSLRKYKDFLTIKSKQEGYVLFTENVLIDLVEWENKINSAPPINVDTVDKYEVIMRLYTDSYLNESDYIWVEPERIRLENIWISVAFKIGDYYLNNDSLQKAETWYRRICKLRPEEEKAHFMLMQLYEVLGYGVLVHHQYTQLHDNLAELGLDISPHITDWYKKWMLENKV